MAERKDSTRTLVFRHFFASANSRQTGEDPMASSAETKFDSSRVVSRAFDAIGANLGVFIGLAVLFSGIIGLFVAYWQSTQVFDTSDPYYVFGYDFWRVALFAGLIAAITGTLLSAAITRATVQHLSGAKSDFGEALGTAIRLLLPLLGLAILSTIGIAIGFVLLIVPGILLSLAWCVIVPALVQEKVSIMGAFKRSYELTEGNWGNLFVLYLVVGILSWILSWIVGMIGGMFATTSPYIPLVIGTAVDALTALFNVTLGASIYVELRNVKEGVEPNRLEEIFA